MFYITGSIFLFNLLYIIICIIQNPLYVFLPYFDNMATESLIIYYHNNIMSMSRFSLCNGFLKKTQSIRYSSDIC